MLLTGDVEATGESTLATPPCPILKVPHHGSRTSTGDALLVASRPHLAVISAGARNRFSHPHPDVLRRLDEHAVRIFRTDRDGTVRLSTDGERVWVRTGLGGVPARVR
jgi:competence protein ComEC